jgi:L-iditol 2-dehydrogenase
MMKKAFLVAPGRPLSIQEVPVPEPAACQVLVKISVATVCALTDRAIMEGRHPPHDAAVCGMMPHDLRQHLGWDGSDPFRELYPQAGYRSVPFPAPMGHEAAGTIVALGPEANLPSALALEGEPLSVGDRIATFQVPGGYSEYSCLPSSNVIKIPDFMTEDEGSLLEPLIVNYNCLKRCWAINEPRTVAILGQGCQGLLATQIVRALGAKLVIVSDPLPHKRRLALELGADVALDPDAVNVVHEVERLTSLRGVDLVVECAGIEETVRMLPYLVRRTGVVAQIGAVTNPVTFDYGYVHFKNFIIVPCDWIQTFRQVADQVVEILELVKQDVVKLRRLVTHRFALQDINDAFELLHRDGKAVVKVAIDVDPSRWGHATEPPPPAGHSSSHPRIRSGQRTGTVAIVDAHEAEVAGGLADRIEDELGPDRLPEGRGIGDVLRPAFPYSPQHRSGQTAERGLEDRDPVLPLLASDPVDIDPGARRAAGE